MTAGDRTAQVLLVTGWARLEPAGWQLYDPAPGDASAWIAATPEEAAALDATLAAWPTIARIHQGMIDHAASHRSSCAALRYAPCDCRTEVTSSQPPDA